MEYALFLWMAVAASQSGTPVNSWVYQTDFKTEVRCVQAARQLSVKPELYRCVPKG